MQFYKFIKILKILPQNGKFSTVTMVKMARQSNARAGRARPTCTAMHELALFFLILFSPLPTSALHLWLLLPISSACSTPITPTKRVEHAAFFGFSIRAWGGPHSHRRVAKKFSLLFLLFFPSGSIENFN